MDDQALQQKSHYDRIAENYVGSREASPAYRMFLPVWSRRLLSPWVENTTSDVRAKQVVIDPMCGHGNLAPFLLEHSSHVILNDLSPEMVDRIGADLRSQCRVLPPSDARSLPLDSKTVDVVVVSGGLHHVFRNVVQLLTEFQRVLKPGGWLLFGEPSNDFLPVRVLRNTIYRFCSKFDHAHEKGFRYSELLVALGTAGFKSVSISPFGSIGYLLMAQVGVIPVLRNTKSPVLFQTLLGIDRFIESMPILRSSCFALTGSARRPQAS